VRFQPGGEANDDNRSSEAAPVEWLIGASSVDVSSGSKPGIVTARASGNSGLAAR